MWEAIIIYANYMEQKIIEILSKMRHCKITAMVFTQKLITSSSVSELRGTIFRLFQDANQYAQPLVQIFLQLRKIRIKQRLGKQINFKATILRDLIVFQQNISSPLLKPSNQFSASMVLTKVKDILSALVQCKEIIPLFDKIVGKRHQKAFLENRLFKNSFLLVSNQATSLYQSGDLFGAQEAIDLALDIYSFFYESIEDFPFDTTVIQNLYVMKAHLLQCQAIITFTQFRIKAMQINPNNRSFLHQAVCFAFIRCTDKQFIRSFIQTIKKIYPNYFDYAAIQLFLCVERTNSQLQYLEDAMKESHIEAEAVPFYFHCKGQYHYSNDEFLECYQSFKNALLLDQSNWYARSMIGYCCFQMGNFKEALEHHISAEALDQLSLFKQTSKIRIALDYLALNLNQKASDIYHFFVRLQSKGICLAISTRIRLLMIESGLRMTNQALTRASTLLQCKLEYNWQRIHIKIIQLINMQRKEPILKLMPIIQDIVHLYLGVAKKRIQDSHLRFMTVFCYHARFLDIGRLFMGPNIILQLKQGYYERQVSKIELLNFLPI